MCLKIAIVMLDVNCRKLILVLFRSCFDFIPSFYRSIPMGCLVLISIGSFTERKSLLDCKLHTVGMGIR